MVVLKGQPRHTGFSLGGGGDSYYEYLLKNWILTGKKDEVIFIIFL